MIKLLFIFCIITLLMVACESAEEGPGAPRMLFLEIETEYRQAEDITIARARIHRDVADGQVVSMINDVQMILNYLPMPLNNSERRPTYNKVFKSKEKVLEYRMNDRYGGAYFNIAMIDDAETAEFSVLPDTINRFEPLQFEWKGSALKENETLVLKVYQNDTIRFKSEIAPESSHSLQLPVQTTKLLKHGSARFILERTTTQRMICPPTAGGIQRIIRSTGNVDVYVK